MRIAISNIAWDVRDDERIALLLARQDVNAIDVAPAKYFPDIKSASLPEIRRVRDWWESHGIEITGMQALLFGTTGLNLFGDSETRQLMLDHLGAICRIGSGLGAARLVFGSPRNRDRTGIRDDEALERATLFFRALGEVAARDDVIICLEPNPARYGANFMLDSAETAAVVSAVDHKAIRMQLDIGAITINGEDPYKIIEEYHKIVGHIHASEPDLVTLGDGESDHALVGSALHQFLPEHVVSVEMLPAKTGENIQVIERALRTAITHYGRRAA